MFETLAHGDLSLLVKAGVQWGLLGGAVLNLGTRKHHDAYLAMPGPASSSSAARTRAPARTTSATPRATEGWPSCSPS